MKTTLAPTKVCRAHPEPKSIWKDKKAMLWAVSELGAAAANFGCRPSAANDPSAVYGYLNGKHTLIVSHVFNADVYQNRLGQELSVAPDLQSASNQFACFYEIQLTQDELSQCGSVTGVPGYVDPTKGQLTEKDIWRLMVLKESQTTALTNIVIPVRVLHAELKQNWAQNPSPENTAAVLNTQALSQLTPSATQTQAANLQLTQGSAYQFVGLETLLGAGASLLGGLLNRNKAAAENQATNSTACLVAQRTANNPVQQLVTSFLNTLGNKVVGDNPNPIVTVITGTALGFVNNLIGNVINGGRNAYQEASDRCAREVVTAAAANENGTQIPIQAAGVNPQAVLQAASAVQSNNSEELKKILEAETTRVLEAMQAENFQMSSTLKDAMYNVEEKGFHELRTNVKSLSDKLGSQMNGSACLPPARFVKDVLKMALSEKTSNIDSAENLNRIKGCTTSAGQTTEAANTTTSQTPNTVSNTESNTAPNTGSGPVQSASPSNSTNKTQGSSPVPPTAATQTPSSSPASSTIQSAPAPITTTSQQVPIPLELQSRIEELERRLKEMNDRITQANASGSSAILQSAGTNTNGSNTSGTAFEAIKQKYAGIAPETCFSSSFDFKSLSADELDTKRLATCKTPLSASTPKDTFGLFPKELREKCVTKSVDTIEAKATCLCSCRWDASFYQYLKKQ